MSIVDQVVRVLLLETLQEHMLKWLILIEVWDVESQLLLLLILILLFAPIYEIEIQLVGVDDISSFPIRSKRAHRFSQKSAGQIHPCHISN